MDFRLTELENIFYKISDIIEYIETSRYSNRRFKIYMGNGDNINFSIPNEAISHLLGINTTYIVSTGLFKNKNSFLLLKELCENPYRIHTYAKNGQLQYNKMFSKFIAQKINGFKDNIKIDCYNTELVCKYDPTRTYHINNKNQKYDYIIVKKYDDDKIGILCLVKTDKLHNYYVPMSSQLFNNFDEAKNDLKVLIENQAITIITGINSNNTVVEYSRNNYINIETKIAKINNMLKYKSNFNSIIDISGDYTYTLSKLKQNKNDFIEDNFLINEIEKNITDGKFIDKDIYRDTSLIGIINAFNDFLSNNSIESNSENKKSYTKLKTELTELKEKFIELNSLKNNLDIENNELKQKNEELTQVNNTYQENEEKILKIIKPRN